MFFNDIILKYPDFNTLSERNTILFHFNNIYPFLCKKLAQDILFSRLSRKENKDHDRNLIVINYFVKLFCTQYCKRNVTN